MNRFIIMLLGVSLFLGGLVVSPLEVSAGDKPLLSEAIKKAIDTKGADAAKKQFAKDYAANKNRYQVDTQNVMVLMSSYAGARNGAAANAVVQIAQPYMNDQAMAAHNAKASKDAKKHKAMSEKVEAAQKAGMKEQIAKREKQIAEYKAADARRVAQYEAKRKAVFFKPGGAPIKPTGEDTWYILRTLNVDAKGVSMLRLPADTHAAALAAGFRNTRHGKYAKGPIALSVGVDPGRNLTRTIRYDVSRLSPAQWEAYAKKIMDQLGRAGPSCIRRSGSQARLKCKFALNSRKTYAMVEISGRIQRDSSHLKLMFQQGP